jgi:hypothetical protein
MDSELDSRPARQTRTMQLPERQPFRSLVSCDFVLLDVVDRRQMRWRSLKIRARFEHLHLEFLPAQHKGTARLLQ